VVRQLVGYDRYEGAAAVAALEGVYDLLHVCVNGYLPVMKLVGKERNGARVRKRYDVPQTPHRRAEAAGVLRPEAQEAFAAQVAATGPLHVRRQLDAALAQVWARRVGLRPHPPGHGRVDCILYYEATIPLLDRFGCEATRGHR
jgi:hypothetical protein